MLPGAPFTDARGGLRAATAPRCFTRQDVIKNWLNRRLLQPLLGFLRQGMAPDRLALCVAIGIVVGNIPILGVSTILCACIALIFRLNLPAMQLVQAVMAPSQIVLIIPFVRVGEWITRAPRQPLTIDSALAVLAGGVGRAIFVLWDAIVHAGIAWCLIAPFATYAIYRLLTPVFARAAAQLGTQSVPDRPPTS